MFSLKRFLIPPNPWTNIEKQKYYQNRPRINRAHSRNNLPKTIKDGAHVISLYEYADAHWYTLVHIELLCLY